jgi:3-methylcrotonyl-CoA carboxylase alpha subunit
MIAKVIVWDRDRPSAVRRLQAALAGTEVVGVTTNRAFLAAIANHPAFAAAELDTGFVGRYRDALLAPPPAPGAEVLALASLAEILRSRARAARRALGSGDPHSPWHATSGWRLNVETHRQLLFLDGERELAARVHYRPDGVEVEADGRLLRVEGRQDSDGALLADLGRRRVRARALWQGDDLTLLLDGASYRLRLLDPLVSGGDEEAGDGRLSAPMPGKVVQVKVAAGAAVSRGDALMVLEAMKMEHTLLAPADGTVTAVHYAQGDQVEEGVDLLEFEASRD